jgi:hypothetical protein
MPRPKIDPFVVFEAYMPDAMKEYFASKLQKEG